MYPLDYDALAYAIAELLVARGHTLAVVETTAGGLISTRLLSVPGASRWFDRGLVAYSEAAKQDIYPDASRIMEAHGAVSREFVTALVERMRERAGVDFVLGESGIAGPVGTHRSAKPVGSVVIGIASGAGTQIEEFVLPGTRTDVMKQVAQRALEFMHAALLGRLDLDKAG